jgi:hypothetical protein
MALPLVLERKNMNKHEILKDALVAREQEVMGYQINIDNYTLAIEHIKTSGDEDLADFCQKLEALLASEKLEQKKAKVMRFVVQQQLGED